MNRSYDWAFLLVFVCIALLSSPFSAWAGAEARSADKAAVTVEIPVKGMVTLLDLGADRCIPCKMMAPILAKVEKAYEGRAAIVFIDVWKHRNQATRFGIHAIPTQIFFDADGKEVYRHVGFMSEDDIVKQLEKMGVPDA